jgi:hypothetical protein
VPVGIVMLILALIVGAIQWMQDAFKREASEFREQVSKHRREGRPWLYLLVGAQEGRPWLYRFVAGGFIIGNTVVLGVAGFSRYVEGSCRALTGDCLSQVPYSWVPLAFLAASMVVFGIERIDFWLRSRHETAPRSEEPSYERLSPKRKAVYGSVIGAILTLLFVWSGWVIITLLGSK